MARDACCALRFFGMTAAAALITEFEGQLPTLAILKHTNPCGVGRGVDLHEAWQRAFATDRQAPFGGIIAVNRPLDLACAKAIAEIKRMMVEREHL